MKLHSTGRPLGTKLDPFPPSRVTVAGRNFSVHIPQKQPEQERRSVCLSPQAWELHMELRKCYSLRNAEFHNLLLQLFDAGHTPEPLLRGQGKRGNHICYFSPGDYDRFLTIPVGGGFSVHHAIEGMVVKLSHLTSNISRHATVLQSIPTEALIGEITRRGLQLTFA